MDYLDKPKREGPRDSTKRPSVSPNKESSHPYAYINDELIRKMTNEYDFSKITILNFHLKLKGEAKIKKIEGLSKLVNLEELNLSYNLISYIENLDSLKRLKDLNLAENNIKKIENLDMLSNLEKLNLNGNLIKAIPDSIKSLTKLNTLRLARNRIEDPEKMLSLQFLPNLKHFSISDNPINLCPGHIDFCLYLNAHIEVIDSRKITDEHRRTTEKVFMLTQSKENRDLNKERQGEIESLSKNSTKLIDDKNKLKEENQKLKKTNQELEEEVKALREVLDEKNHELTLNFEKITMLEQELAQYKIDYLYSKLGSEREDMNLTQERFASNSYSTIPRNGRDEISKIEKTISMLMNEKKENIKKVEELKQDKAKYWNDLNQIREKIQKLNDEIEFMNKKFMRSSSYERFSPERTKREKELRLASLQVQTEQLRERSLDLETKIEGTKEKIRKTTNLLKKTQGENEGENDMSVLKTKLDQLNEKLRGYEKSNEEIISAIVTSDREIRALTEEMHSDKRPVVASASKNSKYSAKTGMTEEENNEILRAHYDNEREQLNELRKREAELIEKHEKVDLQLEYLVKQIKSCEEKVSVIQEDKRNVDDRSNKGRRENLQVSFESKKEEYTSRPNESLRVLKVRLLGLLSSLKQAFNKVNELSSEDALRNDVTAMDDIILALNKDKTENVKALEGYLQKIYIQVDAFKDKVGDILEKRREGEKEYTSTIRILQEKLEQKSKQEKGFQQQLTQKEAKLEKASVRIEQNLAQREAQLEEITMKLEDLREKKFEVTQALKKIFQQVNQHRKKMRSLEAEDENDTSIWNDRTYDFKDLESSEDIEDMISKLKKVFKMIERNISKIETFNDAKSQILDEFEKQTKELEEGWKDFQAKKDEFKQKMMQEREENLQKIKEEYQKIEEECLRLEENRKQLSEEKRKVEREKSILKEEHSRVLTAREQSMLEFRREQEQNDSVKYSLDSQIVSMKKEIESLRMEIANYELKKEKVLEEYNKAMRTNDIELRRQMAVKEEIDKIDSLHNRLIQQKEDLHIAVQGLEHEKHELNVQVLEMKAQIRKAEDDFKATLEKQKVEERNLKKSIDNLNNEAEHKKTLLNEFEETFHSLNEEIALKKKDLNDLEKKVGEFDKEKEAYRRTKLEHAQLMKEMEETRMRMEEIIFKVNLQEENLNTVKNQIESANLILKEKQNEIIILEKRNNKLNETMNDYQIKIEQLRLEFEAKEDDIKGAEMRKSELFYEYDRLSKKTSEAESVLAAKEGELEGVSTEIQQKMQELQELNEMIEENDSKYRKIIKENRDALDKTLLELREKEEEYHSILVEIDRLTRQKEEAQGNINKIDREVRTKEEMLNKLIVNIEHSQSEIQAMNENIITLTEKEAALEDRLQKYGEVEHTYETRIAEIEHNLENLCKEEEELTNRVLDLQQKEDSIYVLMALNGEKLSEKIQQRIKKMVSNHFYIQDIQSKIEKLETENSQLRQQQVISGYTGRNQNVRTQNFTPEDRGDMVPSFNYRLNFGKKNFAGIVQDMSLLASSSRHGNLIINSERHGGEALPLRESTRDNRPQAQERGRVQTSTMGGMERTAEGTGDDLYNFTSEDTNDVNMVLQKIEEARRHISVLENESKRDYKENQENRNSGAYEPSPSKRKRDDNIQIEDVGESY